MEYEIPNIEVLQLEVHNIVCTSPPIVDKGEDDNNGGWV